MRMSVLGMILAGGEGTRLAPLTDQRAKPSVPFGGKYRIIDFVLSNFVNSGINSIFVLTQFKSQSLMEHIINGWNISNTQVRGSFIIPVPAQMQTQDRTWYRGTADAIYQNMHLIEDFNPDLVAVFGGDHIYKMDISQMIDFHACNNAIATVAAIPVPISEGHQFGIIQVDKDWRIIGFQEKPEHPTPLPNDKNMCLASMGNYIFNTKDMISLLKNDYEHKNSSHDFGKDIIPSLVETKRLFAYNFYSNRIPGQPAAAKPYWRDVGTIKAYFEANMDLRSTSPQLDLYNDKWPIYNYHFSLPAAKFVHNEEVDTYGLPRIGKAINSIVCDGCIVSGSTVTNSVLFNSVHVHSYATVHNCILLNDVSVGEHSRIRNCIIDKHNVIPPNTVIGYDRAEDEKHYQTFPLDDHSWLTVIPKNRHSHQLELKKTLETSAPQPEKKESKE
ncbi:MAG: glucose-1-phosphate adenylyltransferase [Lentisphaeria bacterium]|nr:glucose-1-phosphate adenylyltransferase [Lentisphaeria bacterium]